MSGKQNNQTIRKNWESHITRWEKSGLNQTEYCRKNKISSWSFSNWKNRLLKEKTNKNSFVELPVNSISNSDSKPVLEFSLTDDGLCVKVSSALLEKLKLNHVST